MTDLVERATRIRPILEQHLDEADRLRRLPDANVRALQEAGLCRLMVPRRLGSLETDIHTFIAVMAELGRGCGATSWVASLVNVCAWLAGLFPDRAQRDIWGPTPRRGSRAPWRRTARRRRSTAAGASAAGGCGRRAACTRSGPRAAST